MNTLNQLDTSLTGSIAVAAIKSVDDGAATTLDITSGQKLTTVIDHETPAVIDEAAKVGVTRVEA